MGEGPEQKMQHSAGDFFDNARRRVPDFVQRTYSLRGSLELHRMALGLDLLRTPLNVALAPLQVLMRLAGMVAGLLGAKRVSQWLGLRSLVLGTRVTHEVETRVLRDLLRISGATGDLARRIGDAPEVRALMAADCRPGEARQRAWRAAVTLEMYSGTRSAVSEMTTAVMTVILGAIVFRSLTPGMVSVVPRIADIVALDAAIARFPLGDGLGRLWYGVFPVAAGPGLVIALGIPVILLAATITTFAGILADPLQVATGVHRRRLMRLIDALEHDLTGGNDRPFTAREHYFARVFDVVDMVSGLFRHLR